MVPPAKLPPDDDEEHEEEVGEDPEQCQAEEDGGLRLRVVPAGVSSSINILMIMRMRMRMITMTVTVKVMITMTMVMTMTMKKLMTMTMTMTMRMVMMTMTMRMVMTMTMTMTIKMTMTMIIILTRMMVMMMMMMMMMELTRYRVHLPALRSRPSWSCRRLRRAPARSWRCPAVTRVTSSTASPTGTGPGLWPSSPATRDTISWGRPGWSAGRGWSVWRRTENISVEVRAVVQ